MAKNKYDSQEGRGLSVRVHGDNIEKAIRQLKKKILKDGILMDLRERRNFTANTETRLKAEAAGKSRQRRRVASDNPGHAKRLY